MFMRLRIDFVEINMNLADRDNSYNKFFNISNERTYANIYDFSF